MVDLDKVVGRYWTIRQLCRTSHREFDNMPPQDVADRLERLAVFALYPIMIKFGAFWVSSGYRSPEVNAAVGGAKDSAHLYGCAVDIVPELAPVDEMMAWMPRSNIPYDQAIAEHSSTGEWLHVGLTKPGQGDPRYQLLHKPYGKPFETWIPEPEPKP